jgi:hypothetical protein
MDIETKIDRENLLLKNEEILDNKEGIFTRTNFTPMKKINEETLSSSCKQC